MNKISRRIKRESLKFYKGVLSLGKLLIESTSGNRKRKILQYSLYFIIIIIVNIFIGKNIGSTKYSWDSNVSIFLLVNINIILLLVLLIVIFRNLVKVLSESHSNIFGARLKIKLVTFSVFLAVIPVLVVFFFASTLINDSINKWFNNHVDRALSGSYNLMEDYKDMVRKDVSEISKFVSNSIIDKSSNRLVLNNTFTNNLNGFIDNNIIGGVYIFNDKKENIYNKEYLNNNFLENISNIHIDTVLKNFEEFGDYSYGSSQLFWSAIPIKNKYMHVIGAVFTYKIIPEHIIEDINIIYEARKKYRESEFFSYPLKKSYFMLLIMMSLLVIFVGIWGSIYFAKNITKPIEALADASVEISRGNLDIEVKEQGGDEISYLIKTFNRMSKLINAHTKELHLKNQELSEMYNQISRDNMYIDTIFRNVDSALILLNYDMKLVKANEKANSLIVNFDKEFDELVKDNIKTFFSSNEMEFVTNIDRVINGEQHIYSLSFSKITIDENEQQILLVISDVTDAVNAQRISLWKEVATRIAHEVKNPLTPIKLIAERVKKRSFELQDISSKELIQDSMNTIIAETDNLLELVEEFNLFAKLPKAKKYPINISDLVNSVLSLYSETYSNINFNYYSDEDFIVIADRLQLRRVFQNLISNAIFAMNLSGDINITTLKNSENNLLIKIEDTGSGIKQEDIPKIFEPYFSNRSGGTGLGLAIVKKIIEEHSGSISVESSPSGTIFTIILPRGD